MYTETMLRRPMSSTVRRSSGQQVAAPSADVEARYRRRIRRWAIARGQGGVPVARTELRAPLGPPWQLSALRTLYGA